MALSCVVSGIFNIEKYRDFEIPVKSQSSLLKVVSFDRLDMIFYYCSIATLSLFEIFDFKYAVTLKSQVRGPSSAYDFQKTRVVGLPDRERSFTISSAFWIQSTNVTDRQMDTGPQQRLRLPIASRGKNQETQYEKKNIIAETEHNQSGLSVSILQRKLGQHRVTRTTRRTCRAWLSRLLRHTAWKRSGSVL